MEVERRGNEKEVIKNKKKQTGTRSRNARSALQSGDRRAAEGVNAGREVEEDYGIGARDIRNVDRQAQRAVRESAVDG